MTDETTPSRPSLATFLQGPPTAKPADAPAVAPAPAPVPAAAAPAAQPQLDLTPALPLTEPAPDVEPAAQGYADQDGDNEAPATASPTPTAGAAPSFLRAASAPRPKPSAPPRWQWGLIGGLVLLLGLQVIIADRAQLAADVGTRPLVSGLCTVLRCSLPAWHEPSAFSMLSRDIRPVPGQPGALQVQASFRNDARWAQAWPALRLSLSDADGRVIGRRTLQPTEYLGADADLQARLEPGQSAQVSFRLREPASATVAYSFEFQ